MKQILVYAALIALASSIGSCGNQEKPVDANALFASFYKPNADVARAQKIASSLENFGLAGAQTPSDSLKMALDLYDAGNNSNALSLLDQILAVHPDDDIALYYSGVIHMAEGRFDKAIAMLTPVSNNEKSELKFDALWNLGLCYLKTEDGMQDARNTLSALANDSSYPDHKTAKALVDQLPVNK